MSGFKIEATVRETTGKEANMIRRFNHRLPAVIYGGQNPNVLIEFDTHMGKTLLKKNPDTFEIDVEGNVEKVRIQEVQWDTFGERIMHFDFLRVE